MPARVLVVDDETELGEALRDLLDLEGYEAVACSDVTSARKVLAGGRFDIAMVDVFLDGRPVGAELARHILAEYPEMSVVLMTGYADKADVDAACLSGAYTCLAKPFNLDDVVRVIGMALEGKSGPKTSVPGGRG